MSFLSSALVAPFYSSFFESGPPFLEELVLLLGGLALPGGLGVEGGLVAAELGVEVAVREVLLLARRVHACSIMIKHTNGSKSR